MTPYYEEAGIQIFHGDCREILPTLGPVDLVLTDPPYGVDLGEHRGATETRTAHVLRRSGYDSYVDSPENFKSIVVPALSTAIALCDRSMVFCSGNRVWEMPPANAIGGIFIPAAQGRNPWGFSSLSHCLLYGSAPQLNLGAKATAIRSMGTAESNGHPCPKPLAWMRWAVQLGSLPGDTILDPFMGSGTTLRAAKDLGRKAIGIEIEEKYCEIAAKRLAQGVLAI